MKKQTAFWLGLVFVLSFLMVACSGTTQPPQTEEPIPAVSTATEEPEPTESVAKEDPKPAENVATEEPESTGPRFGDIAPDFTLPDSNGNEVSLGETLQENEQVVIVFYIGVGCTPCMAQLREIENDRVKYEEKGAHVIAIAVQSEENAEFTRKTVQAQFPILADYRDVAKAYGVFELRFPILDEGVSTPSVFIIDKDQQIVWSEITHVEGCGTERVPSQTILEKLR